MQAHMQRLYILPKVKYIAIFLDILDVKIIAFWTSMRVRLRHLLHPLPTNMQQ